MEKAIIFQWSWGGLVYDFMRILCLFIPSYNTIDTIKIQSLAINTDYFWVHFMSLLFPHGSSRRKKDMVNEKKKCFGEIFFFKSKSTLIFELKTECCTLKEFERISRVTLEIRIWAATWDVTSLKNRDPDDGSHAVAHDHILSEQRH